MTRRNQAAEFKHMETCFLCGSQFQFGPHLYDGKYFREWDIIVCSGCESANSDGIVPTTYPHLTAHLKARGTQVRVNSNGWIAWPI